jgi:hypothetical protein
MSIATKCPSCHRKFAAPDHALGKSARCPQCGNSFIVQLAGSSTAPVPAQPSTGGSASAISPRPSPISPARAPARRSLLVGVAAAVVSLLVVGIAIFFAWRLFRGEPAVDWKEYSSTEGGFSVLLPANPEQKEQADAKIVSATKIREVSAGPAGAPHFSVQFYDLADRPINDYLYFSWLKNHLLEKGGKLARENEVSLVPYQCKEFVVDLPNDQILVRRIYLAELRVFLLTAEYPKAVPPTPDAQKFFDSFKIKSVPKAELPPPTQVAMAEPKEDPAPPAPAPKKEPDPPPAAKTDPVPSKPPETAQPAPKKDANPPPVAKSDPAPSKPPETAQPPPKKDADPPVAKTDPAPSKPPETAQPAPKKDADPPPVAKADPAPSKPPEAAQPAPKKEADAPPAVTAQPKPAEGADDKLVINPEEQAVVDAINRLRKKEKSPLVEPIKVLFEGARSEAALVAVNKASKTIDYGYSHIYRLTLPTRAAVSAQELINPLIASKASRAQLADEELHLIGVGMSTNDGVTYYMIIMCGAARGE